MAAAAASAMVLHNISHVNEKIIIIIWQIMWDLPSFSGCSVAQNLQSHDATNAAMLWQWFGQMSPVYFEFIVVFVLSSWER